MGMMLYPLINKKQFTKSASEKGSPNKVTREAYILETFNNIENEEEKTEILWMRYGFTDTYYKIGVRIIKQKWVCSTLFTLIGFHHKRKWRPITKKDLFSIFLQNANIRDYATRLKNGVPKETKE